MPIIDVENVYKSYAPHPGARRLLGRDGLRLFSRRDEKQSRRVALQGVSFTIEAGECVGFIGANGSGKTTLLRVLSGITTPTEGRVSVYGRTASLIDLGAGFHDLLTGRENAQINGRLLGMSKGNVDAVLDRIVEFSEIGEAIDFPVGTYSSGMRMRLAFAIAVHADPDVYLLDEILAVGDESFQRKCHEKIEELRDAGKTFVYISHDLASVSALCDRCFLLTAGELTSHADVDSAIDFYVRQSIGSTTHRLAQGNTQVLFRDGRLSIYRSGQEITSNVGCQTNLMHHEQWRHATFGNWRIVEQTENSFVAEGRMPALPVVLRWTVALNDGRIQWDTTIRCEGDAALEEVECNIYLPTSYGSWRYEGEQGDFPAIEASDVACLLLVGPELSGARAAATSNADGLPPVSVSLVSPLRAMRLRVQNTDYALGCRLVQAWARLAGEGGRIAGGTYELASLMIDLGESDESLADTFDVIAGHYRAQSEEVEATFDGGRWRLRSDSIGALSALNHVHWSIRRNGVWRDIHQLACGLPVRSGTTISYRAEIPDCAAALVCEVEETAEGLEFRAALECEESINLDDWRFGIGLDDRFTSWRSDHSEGALPEAGQAGTDLPTGTKTCRVSGSDVPNLELQSVGGEARLAIANHGVAVLEIRPALEGESRTFEPGRHALGGATFRLLPGE